MILKILEKLGRKKVVLDRGPSHPEFHKAKPWMERYYLLFRKRPKWFPFNILIHKMLDDDHGEGVHNHLCPYITIVLKGGYWETTNKGKFWRPPGYIGFRSADHLHRVDLKPNTNTMTLFIPGPFGLLFNLSFNAQISINFLTVIILPVAITKSSAFSCCNINHCIST